MFVQYRAQFLEYLIEVIHATYNAHVEKFSIRKFRFSECDALKCFFKYFVRSYWNLVMEGGVFIESRFKMFDYGLKVDRASKHS